MTNGYMGKMLWVDLSNKKIKEEKLDEKLCRGFIGGYGIGARLLYSRQKGGVDPLGPDSIFGIVAGPLSGTQALGGSRYTVVGKSPLTGTWGDANSGGNVGPYLKFAGYDAVFFTGMSPKPVYLLIDNGKAEIRDAAHLWGKDSFETEDILRAELGKDTEVACIGPAGEMLSLIASVMNNKGRCAARSGLGAVMGAKKLKAVALRGNMKIPVFDEAKTSELRKKYMNQLGGPSGLFKQFGTPGLVVGCNESGDSPVKNWDGVGTIDFPQAANIGGENVLARQERKYGCYRCVIACGGRMKEGTGEYKYPAGAHKPEYETLGMFGINCLNDNLESITKANDICNRYGIDTISAAATIAMVIDCYENGLLTKKDTDGLEMTWGNHRSIVAMTEKLAKREGFGAILTDGSRMAAKRIGKGAEKYAMHIAGQEYAAHDGKLGYDFATGYMMDATPGRHTQSGGFNPPGMPFPAYNPKSFTGRGEAQKIGNNINHVIFSAGLCMFLWGSYPNTNVFIEFMNAVTGWGITMDEVLKTGERIANIRHAFNLREGHNPLTRKNPDRVAGRPPKQAGPLAGITLDDETMAREFCMAMDWDTKTAKPSRKKLLELGLNDVAKDLWG
jgi:aldehyde:ferredoxin oxidoreductase